MIRTLKKSLCIDYCKDKEKSSRSKEGYMQQEIEKEKNFSMKTTIRGPATLLVD
jgi:hypothetical protein